MTIHWIVQEVHYLNQVVDVEEEEIPDVEVVVLVDVNEVALVGVVVAKKQKER